jgi:hypothetical protein
MACLLRCEMRCRDARRNCMPFCLQWTTTAVQGVLYNSHQPLPTYSTPFMKACPMANSYTSDDTTWNSTLAPVPTTFTLCPLEGKLSIPSSVQFLDSQTFCSILIWCMCVVFLNNPCRALLYHVANFIRKGWLISTSMMTNCRVVQPLVASTLIMIDHLPFFDGCFNLMMNMM